MKKNAIPPVLAGGKSKIWSKYKRLGGAQKKYPRQTIVRSYYAAHCKHRTFAKAVFPAEK